MLDGSIAAGSRALTTSPDSGPERHSPPRSGRRVPGALADERAYLERLASDCRDATKRGVPLAAAAQAAGLSEKSRWELFKECNARNATVAYSELEWE